MKLSIITATYNSYPKILDIVDSLQQQVPDSIKYLNIDDGSTDLTKSVIKKIGLLAVPSPNPIMAFTMP